MENIEERLDRMDAHIQALAGIVGELAREVRALVQGLAADRAAFRETLRELSGFVATAGLELDRLGRRLDRLTEITEAGFTRMQLQQEEATRLIAENNRLIAENSRQIAENNRQIAENNRQVVENNRLIAENNAVIRRLLDILARGRGDGEGPPQ
jgi:uncharacterized coiled-coil protein SlyX